MRLVRDQLRHRYHPGIGHYDISIERVGKGGESTELDVPERFGGVRGTRGDDTLDHANAGLDPDTDNSQGAGMRIHVDHGHALGLHRSNTVRTASIQYTVRIALRHDFLPGHTEYNILLDNGLVLEIEQACREGCGEWREGTVAGAAARRIGDAVFADGDHDGGRFER